MVHREERMITWTAVDACTGKTILIDMQYQKYAPVGFFLATDMLEIGCGLRMVHWGDVYLMHRGGYH